MRSALILSLALLAAACVTTQGAAVDGAAKPGPASPDPRKIAPSSRSGSELALRRAGPRVVAKLEGKDPIVSLRAVFESGSVDDPVGKEGLTALSAVLMVEATKDLPAGELQQRLFPWAGELGVQVEKERVVFLGRVHRDHAEKFIKIFFDVLTQPLLAQEDLDRIREGNLTRITSGLRGANDENLQLEALELALWDREGPRHPYRHYHLGTVQGLKAITLDDVRAHIARVFTRDRLVLGVTGGSPKNPAAFAERLRAAAGALPETSASPVKLPSPIPLLETNVWIVDKPAAATAIGVGFPIGLTRQHPDYAAMKVAETFFGEHRHRIGWLFQAMREKRGLNYGDYAYVERFRPVGWSKLEQLNIGRRQQYFSIWIRPVEHKARHFALRQAVYELDRFVERGIPKEETLARLKKFLVGHWAAKEQQPMRALGYAIDDKLEGSARDAIKAEIQALTLEQVNAAIKRHLRADKLQIVVVTEGGAAFKDALVKGAPSPLSYAAEPSAALKKEDKVIESWDLSLKPGQVRVLSAGELFEK